MDLAERMRDLREQAGLTKTALAKPRYTTSYVSQIEAGRRTPSPEAMSFFATQLGVSPRYLATGVPEGLESSLLLKLEEARKLVRTGDHEGAEALIRNIGTEAAEHELPRHQATALALMGDSVAARGRTRDAIDYYEAALQGTLSERDEGMVVAALARAYRSVGDLMYATEVVENYLTRREGGPLDPAVSAELQTVLVSVYFERGDVTRAERAVGRALSTATDDVPAETRANTYWVASRVLAEAKRWDEALEYANRARVLSEQVDDQRRVARLHNAYAFICLEVDPPRLEEARRHLDQAEALFADVATPSDLAYLLTERARLELLEGRPEAALAHAERAAEVTDGDELELARALFLKGRALGALTRTAEAQPVLREAAELFASHGARQQEAACWREIGELDLSAGNVDAALEALRAGLQALDPKRSRA